MDEVDDDDDENTNKHIEHTLKRFTLIPFNGFCPNFKQVTYKAAYNYGLVSYYYETTIFIGYSPTKIFLAKDEDKGCEEIQVRVNSKEF